MSAHFAAADLVTFATALGERAGLESEKARAVGEILVEGDLLGHTTHGLALLPAYLADIDKGSMRKAGVPIVVADFPAAVTWDGQRLPGPWLVIRALDLAAVRARQNGVCSVAIRRSHHIGCLAAYLRPIAEQGLMVLLTCSDPNVCSVAPFGGRREVFTPNPLAAAWPTDGEPVILDVSMSITTNGLTKRLHTEGRRFPGQWALTPPESPRMTPLRSIQIRPAHCCRREASTTGTRAMLSRCSSKR
jgi:LDH2 family malate/lactate/ureidoglycolate dehydrogenase